VNLCRTCGEDFASVPAFDEHRVGVYDYDFADGMRMDPPRDDGRRCLGVDELEAAGWRKDRWGRWHLPHVLELHVLERVEL
jgi:hypothetical protein